MARKHISWIAWITLVAYLAASFGLLPAPTFINRFLGSFERFPCETHSCGCATAAGCQNACCCFSQAQRDHWADRNGLSRSTWTPLPRSEARQVIIAAQISIPVERDDADCGMCHIDNAKPALPIGPIASPLGCRLLDSWLFFAPVQTMRPPPALVTDMTVADASWSILLRDELTSQAEISLPDPPPRA